jgi:hypothetical protein
MSNLRILISYSPRLYGELFSTVLRSLCGIEIIETSQDPSRLWASRSEVDIIITSLDDRGKPSIDILPTQALKSKVLAFSPTGEVGLRRMPGSKRWEEISPFGLDQLIREVIYNSPKITI